MEFFKKHKNKLIIAALVISVLAGTWIVGGSLDKSEQAYTRITPPPTTESMDVDLSAATAKPESSVKPEKTPMPEESDPPEPEESEEPSPEPSEPPEPSEAPSPEPTPEPTQVINPDTGMDKYLTDPVPEGKPLPVEPENMTLTSTALTCTLSVRCDTILDNIGNLDREKVELVPPNGVILDTVTVTFYEGESVFNVLQRELRRAGIHMEFVNTPIYNSAYIEGINNLYEFDCGELSGWMYKVNDWFPNYGCSRYQLKQGDVIEWIYTCDLGRDIGGYNVVGG